MSVQSARRSSIGVATVSIPSRATPRTMNGIDRRGQIVATGQPAGRHRAAVADGAQRFGQRPPADAVDDAGPELGTQRPAVVLGELAPDDVGRPEAP